MCCSDDEYLPARSINERYAALRPRRLVGPVAAEDASLGVPEISASAVYLISTETLYLILGFCLLVGAALGVWATRTHVASESLRTQLIPEDRRR